MSGSKGSSMNMNPSSNSGMSGMNSMSGPAVMNQSNPQIKNITTYETAQSLATLAQQTFNKDFKPIAPANATSSTANIEKSIDQLKNAVNNKASFMNVMELVHGKLHPTLITQYNLRLRMPGMSMAGMSMPSKGSSMNMNTSSGNGMSGMSMPSKGSSMNMNK